MLTQSLALINSIQFTVPGGSGMFTREMINANAKRQAARAENVDNAEVGKSNSESYSL